MKRREGARGFVFVWGLGLDPWPVISQGKLPAAAGALPSGRPRWSGGPVELVSTPPSKPVPDGQPVAASRARPGPAPSRSRPGAPRGRPRWSGGPVDPVVETCLRRATGGGLQNTALPGPGPIPPGPGPGNLAQASPAFREAAAAPAVALPAGPLAPASSRQRPALCHGDYTDILTGDEQ